MTKMRNFDFENGSTAFLSKWRQRGDDFTECVKSLISICLYIENFSLNNVILTRFVLTIFVKELSKIAPMIAEKMHFISIERVSTFRAKHSLPNVSPPVTR